ncbi:MAG: DUF6476 family protein [Tropicimonas sp.]|uniref:DUF6476 family protein n=1 Tax=Tropicimonas sp. TaxID=2067044 RepID=UPI003A8ADEEE
MLDRDTVLAYDHPVIPKEAGMSEAPLGGADARVVRYLRILVTVLTVVMVGGMIVLVTVFVQRFPDGNAPAPGVTAPRELDLPEGAAAAAVTRARDFWVVVTGAGDIYFYGPAGGAPLRHVPAPE